MSQSNKAIKVHIPGLTTLGVADISTLSQLRWFINNRFQLESDNYLLAEDGTVLIEDEDYPSAMYSFATVHVLPVNHFKSPNAVSLVPPVTPEQATKLEQETLEFLVKRVLKDPNCMPNDLIPKFWTHCEKIGNVELANYAKSYLCKNPLAVFSSHALSSITESQWEEIVQWEHIQCTEYEIIAFLTKWAHSQANRVEAVKFIASKIAPHIRFGVIPYKNLVQEIHLQRTAFPSDILYSYLKYHTQPREKGVEFYREHKKNFMLREYQQDHYAPNQLQSSQANLSTTAKGVAYTLKMSSQYAGLPNSYETLTSEEWNHPGAATNYGADPVTGYQYLEAAYTSPVIVSRLIVSTPSKGLFQQQGWGNGYLTQLSLRYAKDDDSEFVLVKALTNVTDKDGPTIVELEEPVVGTKFRLTSAGYVATGSFILE